MRQCEASNCGGLRVKYVSTSNPMAGVPHQDSRRCFDVGVLIDVASMTLDVYDDLFDEDVDSVAANLDTAIQSAPPHCGPWPRKNRAS
jgi:hypothetical protein